MPVATTDDLAIHYRAQGSGPTVAFVGDVGLGAWQWGWQFGAVAGPYEALVVESRGCGDSDEPREDCSLSALVDDLHAVLTDHGARQVHLVGAGLGGMVALAYADREARVSSLTLLGTAAEGGAYDPDPLYADPDDEAALRESLSAGLSAAFLDAQPDVAEQITEWRAREDAGPEAYRRLRAALADVAFGDRLYELTDPALVVHGAEDALCPPAAGERLAEGLPRGQVVVVPDAGHLVGVEASRVVNDHLLGFLDEQTGE